MNRLAQRQSKPGIRPVARLYDLVSPLVGLTCPGVIGALGTAIAIPVPSWSAIPRIVEAALALVALGLDLGGFFALRRRA